MIRPLRDLILVTHDSKPGMIGRIHVPDITKSTANQTFVFATVHAAGPKVVLAKPGTTILISEYAGDPHTYDGREYWLLRERDIVGVLAETA